VYQKNSLGILNPVLPDNDVPGLHYGNLGYNWDKSRTG